MGSYRADTGSVSSAARGGRDPEPAPAHALGSAWFISILRWSSMTVAREPDHGRADVPARYQLEDENEQLEDFMEPMPFRVARRAGPRLSAGEKQKVEILKQLYLDRLLILDEPTSVLTPDEADEILGMVREHGAGRRIQRADDHAQIPRGDGLRRRCDGAAPRELMGGGRSATLTPDDMARMMVGDAAKSVPGRTHGASHRRSCSELEDDRADDDDGCPRARRHFRGARRRDRRHRRRFGQRPERAGPGARRAARRDGRRSPRPWRALSCPARRDAAAPHRAVARRAAAQRLRRRA